MLQKMQTIYIGCTVLLFSSNIVAMEIPPAYQDERVADFLDEPPIHCAIIRQDFEYIQQLVEQTRVDVNERSYGDSYTPLHRAMLIHDACRGPKKESAKKIIYYLLEHGAQDSICMKDGAGLTPLHMELNKWESDVHLLNILLQKGSPSREFVADLVIYKFFKKGDGPVRCLLNYLMSLSDTYELRRVEDAKGEGRLYRVLNVWKVDIDQLQDLLQNIEPSCDFVKTLILYKAKDPIHSRIHEAIKCLLQYL